MYWLHISWSVRFKLSSLLRTVLLVCWTCRNHAGSLHLVLITVWNEWCPTYRMVSKHDSHQFEIINQITWNPHFSAFFTILKKGTPSLFPLRMQVDVPVLVEFPRQTGPIRRVEVSVRERLHAWHLVLVLIRCLFPKSQPFFWGGRLRISEPLLVSKLEVGWFVLFLLVLMKFCRVKRLDWKIRRNQSEIRITPWCFADGWNATETETAMANLDWPAQNLRTPCRSEVVIPLHKMPKDQLHM